MEKITEFYFDYDDYKNYAKYPELIIAIASTITMDDIMDRIRSKKGYLSFFAYYEDNQTEICGDAWYNFYLRVNAETEQIIEFTATVVGNTVWGDNETVPDDGKEYDITEYIDKEKCLEWVRSKGVFTEAKKWHEEEEAI